MIRLRPSTLVLGAALLAGCDAGAADHQTGGESLATAGAARQPAGGDATFNIGGRDHPFHVVSCDVKGTSPSGILLRGAGKATDGRRMTVELERLQPGDVVWERATVVFGDYAERDHWEARMGQWPNGFWYSDEGGRSRAEGPLIQISGTEIAVDADFKRPKGDTVGAGVLRASCNR